MTTTTNEEGILNNYATEPNLYYAAYPSDEQQKQYLFQGAIAVILILKLVRGFFRGQVFGENKAIAMVKKHALASTSFIS
jgi:hypothetical protein